MRRRRSRCTRRRVDQYGCGVVGETAVFVRDARPHCAAGDAGQIAGRNGCRRRAAAGDFKAAVAVEVVAVDKACQRVCRRGIALAAEGDHSRLAVIHRPVVAQGRGRRDVLPLHCHTALDRAGLVAGDCRRVDSRQWPVIFTGRVGEGQPCTRRQRDARSQCAFQRVVDSHTGGRRTARVGDDDGIGNRPRFRRVGLVHLFVDGKHRRARHGKGRGRAVVGCGGFVVGADVGGVGNRRPVEAVVGVQACRNSQRSALPRPQIARLPGEGRCAGLGDGDAAADDAGHTHICREAIRQEDPLGDAAAGAGEVEGVGQRMARLHLPRPDGFADGHVGEVVVENRPDALAVADKEILATAIYPQ